MKNGRGQLTAGLLASFLIASVALSGMAGIAHGNGMNAVIVAGGSSQVKFIAERTMHLSYPAGSDVSEMLSGEERQYRFTLDSSEGGDSNGMDAMIEKINQAILNESKSPLSITDATLDYVASIKSIQQGRGAAISYRMEIDANVTGHVLQQGSVNGTEETPAIIDLDWRDVVVPGPIVVESGEFGSININQPAGLLQVSHPEIAQALLESGARDIMEDPIINFEKFGLPMNSWHYLFDVTGKQVPGLIKEGEDGTLSIYSIGESSFREGEHRPVVKEADVSIFGSNVHINAQTPPPSGQITTIGYSKLEQQGDTEMMLVYEMTVPGLQIGFQFQVLMIFGGMMGAIAVLVLFKARK